MSERNANAGAWVTRWSVTIDGKNLSERLNPYLQAIEVTDKDGASSDTCNLTLDDLDGQIKLPTGGAAIAVAFEGDSVFGGTIDEIRSTGARGQGRIITISAKGFDGQSKVKAQLDFHRDNCTLQEFLDDAATRAGLEKIVVDPAFGSIRRDYWSADRESFLALVERHARDLGGTFKVRGKEAVLAKRGTGLTPSGKPMSDLVALFGDNLLSWDVAPYVGRPRGTKARVGHYNRKAGKYEHKDVVIEVDGSPALVVPSVVYIEGSTAHDGDSAEATAAGKSSKSSRDSGEGTVVITLNPRARVEGALVIKGARPGIDGPYRITGVTHKADRSSGATTSIEIKQPGKGTGKAGDTRKPVFSEVDAYIGRMALERGAKNAPT